MAKIKMQKKVGFWMTEINGNQTLFASFLEAFSFVMTEEMQNNNKKDLTIKNN